MSASLHGSNGLTLPDSSIMYTAASLGWRNRIINGAMRIDQRNAGASQTFTAAAAIAYCVDRFYGSCTGANVTGQQVALASNGFAKSYKFTGAASVTGILFGQRIESVNVEDMVSQNVTFSVYTKNSLLTTVTWTAYYANSADTFSSKTQIATGTFTVTSSLARYQATFDAGASAANGICIELTVGAQTSGTWEITGFQFERGILATPFELVDHGEMLRRCKKHYRKSYEYGTVPGTATTTGVVGPSISGPVGIGTYGVTTNFSPAMMAAPTIAYYDTAGNASKVSVAGTNSVTSFTANQSLTTAPTNITTEGFSWIGNNSAASQASFMHYTAVSEL